MFSSMQNKAFDSLDIKYQKHPIYNRANVSYIVCPIGGHAIVGIKGIVVVEVAIGIDIPNIVTIVAISRTHGMISSLRPGGDSKIYPKAISSYQWFLHLFLRGSHNACNLLPSTSLTYSDTSQCCHSKSSSF